MSGFDKIYRKSLLSKIFVKGWGDPTLIQKIIENHKVVSKRDTCMNLIDSFKIRTNREFVDSISTTVEGSFVSPFHKLVPGSMDSMNQVAKFRLIIPKKWNTNYKPLCIHYAGTGDHGFFRRKILLADKLLKDGVASLIHINPFYGIRQPNDQRGSSLNYLSDLFVMGGALILEAQVLLQWAKKEGFHPLAIHGISMGGHMACLGASVYPEPVCLIPCLSWTTASHVFTEGAMSAAVSWDILSQQYNNDNIYQTTIRAAIEPPIPYRLQKYNSCFSSNEELELASRLSHTSDISGFLSHQPSDTDLRNTPYLSPSNPNPVRQLCNDNTNNTNINVNDSAIKSKLTYLQHLGRMEFISFMRSFNIPIISKKNINEKDNDENTNLPKKNILVDNPTMGFMRDILDYFTHLGNYSVPVDTRLVTAVVAENDGYIPIAGVSHFHDVWDNNCEIEMLKGQGHVGAYLRNSLWADNKFREAIVRTLNRYVELYHNEVGPFGLKKL